MTPSLSSRLEFKLKLIWWNLNWIVSPNRPNRLNQRRLRCISRVKNTAQRLKYSRMFDIIMVLWEGIYFEMQRLLCRKVILATDGIAAVFQEWQNIHAIVAAPAPDSCFMNNFHLSSQAQTVTKILSHHFIFIFLILVKILQWNSAESRNCTGLLTSSGFIGVSKTEFQ